MGKPVSGASVCSGCLKEASVAVRVSIHWHAGHTCTHTTTPRALERTSSCNNKTTRSLRRLGLMGTCRWQVHPCLTSRDCVKTEIRLVSREELS